MYYWAKFQNFNMQVCRELESRTCKLFRVGRVFANFFEREWNINLTFLLDIRIATTKKDF